MHLVVVVFVIFVILQCVVLKMKILKHGKFFIFPLNILAINILLFISIHLFLSLLTA